MSNIRDLHREAMSLTEKAFVAKLEGDLSKADVLLYQAYETEVQAAKMLQNEYTSEPTRSVLYRSAASLAIDCNKLNEAEKLVALGISGNPPEDIASELRELFEKVNFQRHLELHGITLGPDEVQMSIAGNAISPGIVPSEVFITRIDEVKKLLNRTIERLLGKPYREGGLTSRAVREHELFLSTPRASSFAVTLIISRPKQAPLPTLEKEFEYIESSHVINEFFDCLELFNEAEENKLKEKIREEPYYRNFIGLAKNMAPDGDKVKLVGFTIVTKGQEKSVGLTKTRNEIKKRYSPTQDELMTKEKRMTTLEGFLKYADELKTDKSKIKLVDTNGKPHNIHVPEGMMSDIVRPMWGDLVKVTGFYKGNVLNLQDIERASSS